jgi:hypothetical protein
MDVPEDRVEVTFGGYEGHSGRYTDVTVLALAGLCSELEGGEAGWR